MFSFATVTITLQGTLVDSSQFIYVLRYMHARARAYIYISNVDLDLSSNLLSRFIYMVLIMDHYDYIRKASLNVSKIDLAIFKYLLCFLGKQTLVDSLLVLHSLCNYLLVLYCLNTCVFIGSIKTHV